MIRVGTWEDCDLGVSDLIIYGLNRLVSKQALTRDSKGREFPIDCPLYLYVFYTLKRC